MSAPDQNPNPSSSTLISSELAEDSLSVLFSRDPLSLANKEIEKIVAALRSQRAKFALQEIEEKTKSKAPKGAKPAKSAPRDPNAPKITLSLEDLLK
jgi:hypothetical protein